MEGLVFALRTQRHLRYILLIIVVVLLASQVLGVDRVGLIALVLAIGLLMVAELINAAVEAAVDLACDSYHPLAKAAKDIAGAAVLSASAIAIFIGVLVFLESTTLSKILRISAESPGPSPLHVALVGAALVCLLVLLGKVWGKKGTLWRGGAVSGHTALAAYLLAAITYKAGNTLVFGMALGLAFLVAQSRVEAGIHTLREVLLGAMVGLAISAAMLYFLA
jgi:diacylglycerol kinase (ATP)